MEHNEKRAALAALIAEHYRPSRWMPRGQEYMDAVIDSRMRDLSLNGRTYISHHDEITGRGMIIYSDLSFEYQDRTERQFSAGNLTHLF